MSSGETFVLITSSFFYGFKRTSLEPEKSLEFKHKPGGVGRAWRKWVANRAVKVLHLPTNIASQISINVRALRALGVEARGLARKLSPMQDYSLVETVDWSNRLSHGNRLLRGIRWRVQMIAAMKWADVIHWHWGESTWKGVDLQIAAWMRKPRLIEFWGSDLRDPVRASRDNRFLARTYAEHPELTTEQCPGKAQRLFSRLGFACLIPGWELADYVDKKFFAEYYSTRACLILSDFTPRFPEPNKARPLVVHAPSNKAKKGTDVVLETMARLSKSHQFDFKLIHQVPRQAALELMAQSDLFLDQFTIGAEGLASYEAMALGKPVVCYIKRSLLPRYPANLPIVVADQDELESAIARLLNNGSRRLEIGRASRQYVEEHHDAQNICSHLLNIYRELCSKSMAESPTTNWRSLACPTAGW